MEDKKVALIFIGFFVFLFSVLFLSLFRVWLKCLIAGCSISLPILIAMKLRGAPLETIAMGYAQLKKAKVNITIDVVEIEYKKAPQHFNHFIKTRISEQQANSRTQR